jgi:hypothetical protein
MGGSQGFLQAIEPVKFPQSVQIGKVILLENAAWLVGIEVI